MEKDIQSYYNEGYFQIQRLNMLKLEANNASRQGSLDTWRWILDNIWRELAPDIMVKYKIRFYSNKLKEHNEFFKEWNNYQDAIKDTKHNPEKLYRVLEDYELFLRSVQENVGKGGKHTDPNEKSMD